MNRTLLVGLASLAAATMLVSGCAGITIGAPTEAAFPSESMSASGSASSSELATGTATESTEALPTIAPGTVGVILPESTAGSRWDAAGQQILSDAFAAAGVPVSIQNAEGDPVTFSTIAQDMTNQGITVLAIVNLDPASGAEAIAAANGLGAMAVDYDRLTPNGGAQYFVGIKGAAEGDTVTPETAKAEAEALVALTSALTSEDPSTADTLAVDMTPDPEAGYDVPSLLVSP